MARWITVRRPFDFRWPSGAITAFTQAELGEHLVKDELADFALIEGYATEGKLDAAARSRKGAGQRRVSRGRKGTAAAKTADARSVPSMGDAGAADADRPADRPPVDRDAG